MRFLYPLPFVLLFVASCTTTKDNAPPLAYHHYQGIYYYEKDSFSEAVQEFEKALALFPNSSELHLNLALAYQRLGELDKATEELKKSIELNTNSVEAYSAMGHVLLESGRADESISYLTKAIKLDRGYADAHNNLGNAYWQLGLQDQAISEYKEAIELNPNMSTAYINLGIAYKESNRLEESLDILKAAQALNSRSPEVYHNMADVYFKMGKYEDAISNYKQALIHYQPEATQPRAWAYGYLGLAYYKGGMRNKAISGFKEVAELSPTQPLIYVPKKLIPPSSTASLTQDKLIETSKFAQGLSSQGRLKEARSLWKDVVEGYLELRVSGTLGLDDSIFKEALNSIRLSGTEKESFEHYLRMGKAYLRKGNPDEALKEFKKAIEEDPTSAEARLSLARTFFSNGEWEAAQNELKKLLFLSPGNPRAKLLMGNLLLVKGLLKEAEVVYNELLPECPESVALHNSLGVLYTYLGRLDEAIKEYSTALKLAKANPSKEQPISLARIHVNLGRAYYRKSLLEKATQEFNKALELDAQQSGAHEGLGLVLIARGKPEDARVSLEKAIYSLGTGLSGGRLLKKAQIRSIQAQLSKGDIAIYQWLDSVELRLREIQRLDELGLTCFDRGDLEQAFFYWQKSLSLEPSLAVAYEQLGGLYAGKEMLDEALLVYRNAAGFYREPGKKARMYLQLGNLRYDRWELEEAINEYRRALQMEPGMAMAYTRLGRVYCKQDLLEKAEREHKKALELEPNLAEAHKNLGLCYDKQGQPGEASKAFKKYLAFTLKE